ncbi:MAG: hypothetical protein QGH83_13795 [Candidatus Pacebacteria bacterium]|jgi:hypothetical protein|nr:hypothetical protein [Candidatus Paceibacterota bacterium]|tara:strand:+ start:213 stop:1151 length:939 start_codon:yes stop_codon:yes gene_type:complete
MATYLALTNFVLARMNEVELTSANWANSRGIQTLAKNAVNDSIRWINQKEFNWPFNHTTKALTVTPGVADYSLPADAKVVDYNTFRLVEDSSLSVTGNNLNILTYYEYVDRFIEGAEAVKTTTLNEGGTLSAGATTITVVSTSDFSSTGTIQIDNEKITYTGTTSTTFTGCTRGSDATTHTDGTTVAQFDSGGIPTCVIRKLDNNFALYPYPDKTYIVKYDYFTFASDLSASTDTPTIPDRFAAIIVDGATAYVYQYRGEIDQYQANFGRFEAGIKNMQSLLSNRTDYVRSTVVMKPSGLSEYFSSRSVGSS